MSSRASRYPALPTWLMRPLAVLLTWLIVVALLSIPTIAAPQAGHGRTLHVSGYPGEAALVRMNGRTYVDVEALARITNGSLAYHGNQIVLTPSPAAGPPEAGPAGSQTSPPGFSREFMKAAVEAMTAMREWGSTLKLVIENGYPVGDAMARYQHEAADKVRLASVAVSTDSDRSGIQLLTNELSNVQTWSNELVNARNSMNAANLATSNDALENDPLFQKALKCGQFLIPMFASGTFQDDASCH